MSREEALQNLRQGLKPLAGPFDEILVNGVDVQGRCADKLVKAHIQPLFEARTVDELVESFDKVQSSLGGLGIFQDVGISITPEKIVTISLVPMKKYAMGIGSNFSQYEGSGYIRGSICNRTGWGEHISLDISTGTRTKSSHMLRAVVPLPVSSLARWKAEGLAYSSEKVTEWASCKASIHGVSARMNQDNGTSFGVDAVLRTLQSQKIYSSDLIRGFAGDSFKLSLFYNIRHDKRILDDLFPGIGRGYSIDMRSEAAVNPSTSPFFKISANYQSAFRIWKNITGSLNTKVGMLFSGSDSKATHILDRFNLGGPLDIRGFRFNHLGPHDNGDATGGEVLFASGLSVFTPLSKSNPNLKLHNFVNVGYLGSWESSTIKEIMKPTISTGIGLCYTNPQARFELNFNMPLVARSGELCQKGLQFGVGLEFL